jgi:predicted acylesterase/phospholipase RssA
MRQTGSKFNTSYPSFDLSREGQGGGALGSYQAGVYQALAKADLHPNWVAGISIGAINAAIIAGNAPDKRVGRLREFWEAGRLKCILLQEAQLTLTHRLEVAKDGRQYAPQVL